MQNLDNLVELTQSLPDGYKENAELLVKQMGEVIEGISDKPIEWRPNTAKVVQAMSDRAKLPKGATIGSIILGEEILPSPLRIIPLRGWDTRQFWSPDKDEAKMLCQSPDGKFGAKGECYHCPHSVYNEDQKKSDCSKSKTFLVITEDLSKVFLLGFTKTNYSNGLEFANLMKKAGVAPFKRVYNLASEPSKKVKNVESMVVGAESDAAKNRTPEELFPFLNALYTRFDDDRKEFLVKFHEGLKSRSASMIEHQTATAGQIAHEEGVTTLVVEDAVEASNASAVEAAQAGAKRYSL